MGPQCRNRDHVWGIVHSDGEYTSNRVFMLVTKLSAARNRLCSLRTDKLRSCMGYDQLFCGIRGHHILGKLSIANARLGSLLFTQHSLLFPLRGGSANMR